MNKWTPEHVSKLWKRQFDPWESVFDRVHPYTCGNRSDGNHIEFGGDLGMLVPTIHGWICPCCDYKQDWSHETGEKK